MDRSFYLGDFVNFMLYKWNKSRLKIPLEKDDLEQRLEKKLGDVNSFNNSIKIIKEIITYFKDKNIKSKKKCKNYKTLNLIIESIDTIGNFGSMSTSKSLSITGIGLVILTISTGNACTLLLGNKVMRKLIINKYNKQKKTI